MEELDTDDVLRVLSDRDLFLTEVAHDDVDLVFLDTYLSEVFMKGRNRG